MVKTYQELKEWRAKKPNYNRDYMRKRRKEYRSALKAGIIKIVDIPKSFRPAATK